MVKTLDDVLKELKAAGYEGTPTPEVCRQYGWVPQDWTEGVVIAPPTMTAQEVKDKVAHTLELAKAQGTAQNVIDGILAIGKVAIGMLV